MSTKEGAHEIPALGARRSSHRTAEVLPAPPSARAPRQVRWRRPLKNRHVDKVQSAPSARPRGRIAPAWTGRTGLLAPARFKAFPLRRRAGSGTNSSLVWAVAVRRRVKRDETTMRKWALSSALLLLFLLTTLPDPGMSPPAGDLQFFFVPLMYFVVCGFSIPLFSTRSGADSVSLGH